MCENKFLFYLCFLGFSNLFSQPIASPPKYYTRGYLPIKSGIFTYTEPFIGGFNSTQFQNFDLNNDGIMDIVCFERTDSKILPFIRLKNKSLKYAPEYEAYFPAGQTYYKMADLNSDKKMDIFTLVDGNSLHIYLNTTKLGDSVPKFKDLGDMYYRNQYAPPFPILYNGLALSIADLPEISDVDGDGDVDIITYDQSNQIYKMFSDVRSDFSWNKDTFEFQIMDICFGYFNDYLNTINLGSCPYKDKLKPRHVGGASILMFDNDEDGDKEVVLSNIGSKHMTFLKNGKKEFNHRYDTMVLWDSIFPRNTTRACDYDFPAGFMVDIDGDSILDLVTSPNGDANNPGNVREINQLWYYRNFGKNNKPDFKFQKDNLLQEQTLDLGGKTAPAFADYDGDGDMDLFIANDGDWEKTKGTQDRIALYKNVGKKDSAKFEFVTGDYLSISSHRLSDLIISFGDVDGDGDADLLAGERTGQVWFFKNSGGKGNAMNLTLADSQFVKKPSGFGISNAAPVVFNYDNDSLPDLLVGYYYGGVKLFKNTGTKSSPSYTLSPGNAYGMRANEWVYNSPNWIMLSYGNAVPTVADFDHDGNQDVLVSTGHGIARLYHTAGHSVFDSLQADIDWVWQMNKTDSTRPDFGANLVSAAIDLDGDSIPEVIMGNSRGGLNIVTSKGSKVGVSVTHLYAKPAFNLFPNPSNGSLTIQRGNAFGNWEIGIYSVLGNKVYSTALLATEALVNLNLSSLPNGVYLAEVWNGISKSAKKFIINRN